MGDAIDLSLFDRRCGTGPGATPDVRPRAGAITAALQPAEGAWAGGRPEARRPDIGRRRGNSPGGSGSSTNTGVARAAAPRDRSEEPTPPRAERRDMGTRRGSRRDRRRDNRTDTTRDCRSRRRVPASPRTIHGSFHTIPHRARFRREAASRASPRRGDAPRLPGVALQEADLRRLPGAERHRPAANRLRAPRHGLRPSPARQSRRAA